MVFTTGSKETCDEGKNRKLSSGPDEEFSLSFSSAFNYNPMILSYSNPLNVEIIWYMPCQRKKKETDFFPHYNQLIFKHNLEDTLFQALQSS